jgi:hypothetical protein
VHEADVRRAYQAFRDQAKGFEDLEKKKTGRSIRSWLLQTNRDHPASFEKRFSSWFTKHFKGRHLPHPRSLFEDPPTGRPSRQKLPEPFRSRRWRGVLEICAVVVQLAEGDGMSDAAIGRHFGFAIEHGDKGGWCPVASGLHRAGNELRGLSVWATDWAAATREAARWLEATSMGHTATTPEETTDTTPDETIAPAP